MAWTVDTVLDFDKANVGSALAVWNVGLEDEFVYERRITMNAEDMKAFVDEAKANLAKSLTKEVVQSNFSVTLASALNS